MRIDRDGDEVSMVLSKQDMIDLKNMFDSHMMIPKYSIYGKPQSVVATTSATTNTVGTTLWPGVKSWYNQDSFEILGKLIRAFDLILENKNTGGKEIE